MSNMFHEANTWDQNIGSWDTSNVKDMNFMFTHATSFNQCLGSWAAEHSTNMDPDRTTSMFYRSGCDIQIVPNDGPWCQTARDGCKVPELQTLSPAYSPVGLPTDSPFVDTDAPTSPTDGPSSSPSGRPSISLSSLPSSSPSNSSSIDPTGSPTDEPSYMPSEETPAPTPIYALTNATSVQPTIEEGYSFKHEYEPTPYLRVGPGKTNSCRNNKSDSICKDDNICRGDCGNHADCNPFTTLVDGSIVVSNFTMVCVENPLKPLGPCTGNPQGTRDGNTFTGNWAATKGPLARDAWFYPDKKPGKIDYCVPACNALIHSVIHSGLGFMNDKLTPQEFKHHCEPQPQIMEEEIIPEEITNEEAFEV